jgi:hypothetical protein
MLTHSLLTHFVTQSNALSGKLQVDAADLSAHERLLARPYIVVADLEDFVSMIEPGARLRHHLVKQSHLPQGSALRAELKRLTDRMTPAGTRQEYGPAEMHARLSHLSPFNRGNDRLARAVFLYMIGGPEYAPDGFLQAWYEYSLRGWSFYYR